MFKRFFVFIVPLILLLHKHWIVLSFKPHFNQRKTSFANYFIIKTISNDEEDTSIELQALNVYLILL